MKNPTQSDKGCLAKVAIVHALTALDERATDIFLQGTHHIQKEASWGGSVDTAGELRGRCIVALAESGYPDALLEIASLLVDSDAQARVGAVRACTAIASIDAPALLRLKLLTGDEEPIVLGEACAALLSLDAEKHADFLRQFLDKPDTPLAQAAISSLAESRHPAAFHMLKKMHKEAVTSEQRSAALQALAMLRVDGAPEFLLDLVEHDLHPRAREVLASLYARRDDEPFRRRLDAALERRDDKLLQKYAAEIFSSDHPPRTSPNAIRK
jgi:HEAT repeat protein